MAKPKPRCANGCDAPAESPRFIICRACIDKITRNLEEATLAEAIEAWNTSEGEPKP